VALGYAYEYDFIDNQFQDMPVSQTSIKTTFSAATKLLFVLSSN
jgi:hypothetical protein